MPEQSSSMVAVNTPLTLYQSLLNIELVEDPSQLQAIEALEALFDKLGEQNTRLNTPIKGVYLWGDVGRGKTFLMDLFYECLPKEGKLRLHFHRFMARIHGALRVHAGKQDPLVSIAKDLAKNYRIVCFDEFFVSDIGDAMILAGLFTSLFQQGVVLVATSNIPIEQLYENGLARHKFLPFIELLQQHTDMLHFNGKQDHRLNHLDLVKSENANIAASRYLGNTATMDFAAIFCKLSQSAKLEGFNNTCINICHREIPVICATNLSASNAIVWFDFLALCDGPRSQLDYMEIATRFNTVMVSGVPQLGGQVRGWIKARGTEDGIGKDQAAHTGERIVSYAENDDITRRFISLIDELYDQKVTLYLSTDVPLSKLYLEGALTFEFRRTYSRLIEMSQA